ncbi:Rpn family recombination-promoting nuclease/putative transposase [Azospirillum halopraeferens]|uniref:Rpn family recombination-promoting nuclease/putative transposase n=1 Tax=Azospirillum halopraeferens TaxID=34010 RepID=UPI0004066B23|nr:Rpn family recombination-promoting nuclease/putative transposase [Azospirillum halopraeferens]
MSEPSQPHDKLFKALTDDPRVAGALIRERLPGGIAALLSDDPPEPVEGSFIDEDLRGSRSDRLFRVRTRGGGEAFLYALVEHKSVPDPGLPLQLLGYMLRIWQRHAGRDPARLRALPAIIPLVVYHGARAWTVPTAFRELIAADESVRRHHLDFAYALTDLGRIDDARLSDLATLRAGLLALKYALRETDPWPVLVSILEALPENDPLVRPLLVYILSVYEGVDRPMLIRAIHQAKPEGEGSMVSLAAREWIAEGEAKGMAKGKAEGLHEGQARTLLRLLNRRFGPVSDTVRARVNAADLDALDRWFDRALDAPTLEAVFDEAGSH